MPTLYKVQWVLQNISACSALMVSALYWTIMYKPSKRQQPAKTLRSSADTPTFRVPHRRKKFQGQRAFSCIGPVTWDSLPFAVRHAQTLPSFKSQLKTYLFCQSK